jgi:hypothetical protein
MPTIHHDGPIDVIRSNPDMTADLVRLVTPIEFPPQDRLRIELGANDASNVVPDEFRADMVTVIRDRDTGDPFLLVVIESQGRQDDEKDFAWPAYLANLRAAHRCKAAVLIVICWDAAEAQKCRQVIRMGHPDFVLVPIVIGPQDGQDLVTGDPWLTLLAGSIGGIDLAADSGGKSVMDAIPATGADSTVQRKLLTIILGVASDVARARLEALIMKTEGYRTFLDDMEDRAEARGEQRGEARGEARGEIRGEIRGEARGEVRGEARGRAEALLKLLASRGVTLTEGQRDQVASCPDPERLSRWFDRALVVSSAGEVFSD